MKVRKNQMDEAFYESADQTLDVQYFSCQLFFQQLFQLCSHIQRRSEDSHMITLHLRTYLYSLGFEESPHQLPRRVWREAPRLLEVSKQLQRRGCRRRLRRAGNTSHRRCHDL